MPTEWTTREIDAPTDDMLSGPEVAKLFGFSVETLAKFQEAGKFPTGIKLNSKTVVYDWQSVAFFRLYLTLQGRFAETGLTAEKPD